MKFVGAKRHLGVVWLKFVFLFCSREKYMKHFMKHYSKHNVVFTGCPRMVYYDVVLDASKPIVIGGGTTVATGTVILTHDYAIDYGFVGENRPRKHEMSIRSGVKIGTNCFIGQRCFILPGSVIEDNVIVGCCSVVKGKLLANSVYAGNPARRISSIGDYLQKNLEREKDNIV